MKSALLEIGTGENEEEIKIKKFDLPSMDRQAGHIGILVQRHPESVKEYKQIKKINRKEDKEKK